MNIKDKLRLIQRVLGESQEKLASQLGVSFPTLNSWINGRSLPRKQAQERIDHLFRRLTGQEAIPASLLDAKKQAVMARSRTYKNLLKTILKNRDIYDQFVLSLTFNTNRIEGSTLTEPETAAILFQNTALPNKSIIEQMEVKNHQAALRYVFRHLQEGGGINEAFILKIHGILLNGIQEDSGRYRDHGVRIVGSNVPTANPLKIEALMQGLARAIPSKNKEILRHAAQIHSQFEQIHPFSDGNGRVGRLLLDAMLLNQNLPPAVIRQEKRRLYILYLNKSQTESEFSQLEDFICDAVLDAFLILERKE
jgi:Fic family protein